jgi:primosomal protein N' (replication factor Y)
MTPTSRFADIMLPIPLHRLFTYEVPQELADRIAIGCRVVVPFGNQKIKTGIVNSLHSTPPVKYEAKSIMEVMEDYPIIHPLQIALYQWMADYYMCTIGEVINIAIPAGLKLSSDSFVQLHPELILDNIIDSLSPKEEHIINLLSKADQLSYQEIGEHLGIKNISTYIKSLSEKGAIVLFEKLGEKYKPKKVKIIKLSPKYANDEKQLEQLFAEIENKRAQIDLLLYYLRSCPPIKGRNNSIGLSKATILKDGGSVSALKKFVKNGVFEEINKTISRFDDDGEIQPSSTLSDEQSLKLSEIHNNFQTKDTVLLQGVTGSGKTEIFIKLIEEAIEQNHQVLYLLPEIALTTQIVTRLKKVFGNLLGVYHSKYSDNERVEVWLGLLKGTYKIVVGVRSAVLLPFDNLSLIIIDEEYESTFKQYDPAPRYHARDTAIKLAHLCGAKTLLGTATPSMETYQNVLQGKYGHVQLKSRYQDVKLPEMMLVNIVAERKKKLMKNEFSNILIEKINSALETKEQVIIFQNRRGYAPMLSCEDCGHIPKCHQCAVSLTYHQAFSELRCHYCGYKESVPQSCEVCDSHKIKTRGFGTEKLEEDLELLFPAAKIGRMDLDTTRSKYGYQRIIESFEKKEIDILVGTQMVTKGLDFDNVGLVGVVDADKLIHFPDFRAHEKAYQMITQVSGRAGRKNKQGLVVIQTYDPLQPILRYILDQNHDGFFQSEAVERESFHYPPFYRMIRVIFRHKVQGVCKDASIYYSSLLLPEFGKNRILGPQEPIISKIRNQFIQIINVKLEKTGVDIAKAKKVLRTKMLQTLKEPEFKNVQIIFDVDPQ